MRQSTRFQSMGIGILIVLCAIALAPGSAGAQATTGLQPAASISAALGWTLQVLDPADLEAIASSLGYRAGVMVIAVQPGSPAAQAGCVRGEIILALNGQLADSPQALEALAAAAMGTAELVGFVIGNDGSLQIVKRSITMPRMNAQNPQGSDPRMALQQALGTGQASGAPVGMGSQPGQMGQQTPTGVPAAAPATDLSRGGATWRHPAGFSFWYPDTFSVQDADGGVQLMPIHGSGQSQTSQGEIYFLTAENAQGITSPFDPRVIAYLDGLVVKQISPAMVRRAQPVRVPMAGGEGMFAEWSAAGNSGGTVFTRIYTTILGTYAVFLVAAGDSTLLESRAEELTGILRSIALGQGSIDRTISGVWKLFSTRQITNNDRLNFTTDDPRRASMVSDEQTSLELALDGTARRVSVWRTIAGGGYSGGAGKVWLDSGDQRSEKLGRWNAGSGTLFIVWQNGDMEQWQYAIAGGALKLASSSTVQFWQR